MICPKCKENTLEASFEKTGGCRCGPDRSYCYCDREDYHITVSCHNWSVGCSYRKTPSVLSDLGSIERFVLKMFEAQIQAVVDNDYKG